MLLGVEAYHLRVVARAAILLPCHVKWISYNSFEDGAPVDFIYGCPIFKMSCSYLSTCQGTRIVAPGMATALACPLEVEYNKMCPIRHICCLILKWFFWSCIYNFCDILCMYFMIAYTCVSQALISLGGGNNPVYLFTLVNQTLNWVEWVCYGCEITKKS